MFIMLSLSRERMIEIMNSFVWEWGEKRKECVFIMISLSLLGEEDRNYEFVSMGVGGEVKQDWINQYYNRVNIYYHKSLRLQ